MHQVGAHAHRCPRRDRVFFVLDGHIRRDARQTPHEAVAESVFLSCQFHSLTHESFAQVTLPQSLLNHRLQVRQLFQLSPSRHHLGPGSHDISQLLFETGLDVRAGEDVVGYEAEGSSCADCSTEEDELCFPY